MTARDWSFTKVAYFSVEMKAAVKSHTQVLMSSPVLELVVAKYYWAGVDVVPKRHELAFGRIDLLKAELSAVLVESVDGYRSLREAVSLGKDEYQVVSIAQQV